MDYTICPTLTHFCFLRALLTAYLILMYENKQNQDAYFTTVLQYFPNVTPSVWLVPSKWSVHLTVNKLTGYLVSSAEIQWGVSAACYLWQDNFNLTLACVSMFCCLLKNAWWYCLRKMQAHPPWGCFCLDIIYVSFTVNAALIVYQESEHKAQYEAVYLFKRWVRKSVPTVQWMPLSMVCILRGTKGINKTVLCVLPCCEPPLNAFPRAALEMRYRGPEIENNILNRPSAHVLFLVARERERVRVKLPWPLKFTEERCSPRGSQECYSLRAISCNPSVV